MILCQYPIDHKYSGGCICKTRLSKSVLPNSKAISSILKAHNDFRANVHPPSKAMFKLTWNMEGARKAETLTRKCKFEHDSPGSRAISNYETGGQNLFEGTKLTPWVDIVNSWYDEVKDFNFGNEYSRGVIGHYTQLVWGASREIGCGMTDCGVWKIYACNYYPPGNYERSWIPYAISNVRSCKGCKVGTVCIDNGPYKGILLERCDTWYEYEDSVDTKEYNSKKKVSYKGKTSKKKYKKKKRKNAGTSPLYFIRNE
ncbi:cysteine-rich venom protein VAR7-like [Gordionus sp. m RMFG-2023]|uniref:cysteine-rich venom protein VAR7-like n=1 Tax=Gordionus sp. m RMFG-2023 TaxID=3053472 RepID=UPI0031FDF202